MQVLIIGGAGYVGSVQAQQMIKNGYDVVILDNLSTGHLEMVNPNATFIKGDIRDYDLLIKIFSEYQIDVVMHFAALSLVNESCLKPLDYYDNNVNGFEVLLKAMNEKNINKLVFSSTAAVYGNHEIMPINEEYSKQPLNPYGETKLTMEKMVYWQSQTNNLKYVVLRYFNVAGASLDSEYGELHQPETHLIPLALQVAYGKKEYLAIYGDDYATKDGTCIRDYIHVEDLCAAHILAVEYLNEGNESNTFNLGYNQGYSVKEIIDAVNRVCQTNIKTKIEARRAGDPALLVASSQKAQEILGWKFKYDDLDLIISTANNFYQKREQ